MVRLFNMAGRRQMLDGQYLPFERRQVFKRNEAVMALSQGVQCTEVPLGFVEDGRQLCIRGFIGKYIFL